jgi:hypothetical protein
MSQGRRTVIIIVREDLRAHSRRRRTRIDERPRCLHSHRTASGSQAEGHWLQVDILDVESPTCIPERRLNKTLYGTVLCIKQAPREWNLDFSESIVALGNTGCTTLASARSLMPYFVISAARSASISARSSGAHARNSSSTNMGMVIGLPVRLRLTYTQVSAVLGMQISSGRKNRSLELDQRWTRYIKQRERHNMNWTKLAPTPDSEIDRDHCGSIVGAILYAAGLNSFRHSTRSQHWSDQGERLHSDPSPSDWQACKRILRFSMAPLTSDSSSAAIMVTESGEEDATERLREDVGLLIGRRHPAEAARVGCEVRANEMMLDSDALGLCVVYVI